MGRKWTEVSFFSLISNLFQRFYKETYFGIPLDIQKSSLCMQDTDSVTDFSIQYHKLQRLLALAESRKKWRLRSGLCVQSWTPLYSWHCCGGPNNSKAQHIRTGKNNVKPKKQSLPEQKRQDLVSSAESGPKDLEAARVESCGRAVQP